MEEKTVEELSLLHGSTERILDRRNWMTRLTAMDDVEEFMVGGEDLLKILQVVTIASASPAYGEEYLSGISVDFTTVVERHPRFIDRVRDHVDISLIMTGLTLQGSGIVEDAKLLIENPITEYVSVYLNGEGLSLKVEHGSE